MSSPADRATATYRFILAWLGACALVATATHAATIDWINPTGGTFQVGSNWSGGVPPGTADQARFALVNTPLNVTLTGNVFNQRLIVASGADVAFNNSGINYVANDASANGITIGDVAGDVPARFNLMAGGRIGAFDIALGESVGAAGIGTVGAGASWGSSRTLRIGQAGAGTLSATPGSFITAVAGDTIVGDAATATGFLASDSMFLSVGKLYIGRAGTGTWRITGETSIGSGETIVGDQPGSHGSIDLVSNSEYTLGGSLHVGNGGAGSFTFGEGTTAVTASVFVGRLAGSIGRMDFNAGAFAVGGSMNIGGDATTAGGAGTVAINASSVSIGQTLRAWSGGRIEWNGGTLSAGQVELKPGGRMSIAPSGSNPKLLRVTRLQVDGAAGARLDLSDNAAIVNYPTAGPSPLADLRQQIALGFAGGSWSGDGIASSLAATTPLADALGIAEVSQLGVTSFLGAPVDGTTVVIRYTLCGDANLDGAVTLTDFNLLAANFGQANKSWFDGDFNYDGAVDLIDFNVLAENFGHSLRLSTDSANIPEPAASLLAVAASILPRPVRARAAPIARLAFARKTRR
jgi:hypothetical protein